MNGRILAAGLTLAFCTAIARANQYWVSYDGNAYPEDVGWWRIWGAQPDAQRSLDNGVFTLDTRRDLGTVEYYVWPPMGAIDPGPGEVFIYRWRVKIDEVINAPDAGVTVASDGRRIVGLEYDESSIQDLHGKQATFEPGRFHTFELRSTDMIGYALYIDDALAWTDTFRFSTISSRVSWGEGTEGAASLTHWDYVSFGVVPEPRGVLIVFVATMLARARSGRTS